MAGYTSVGVVNISVNVNALISALVSKTEADMTSYASSTATDLMEAFNKVSAIGMDIVTRSNRNRWP